MTLTFPLPAFLEQKMHPQKAKLHLSVGAFAAEEVTLGQAAAIAGISQTEMMGELAWRRISLQYDEADFAEDLKTISALNS